MAADIKHTQEFLQWSQHTSPITKHQPQHALPTNDCWNSRGRHSHSQRREPMDLRLIGSFCTPTLLRLDFVNSNRSSILRLQQSLRLRQNQPTTSDPSGESMIGPRASSAILRWCTHPRHDIMDGSTVSIDATRQTANDVGQQLARVNSRYTQPFRIEWDSLGSNPRDSSYVSHNAPASACIQYVLVTSPCTRAQVAMSMGAAAASLERHTT